MSTFLGNILQDESFTSPPELEHVVLLEQDQEWAIICCLRYKKREQVLAGAGK